MPEEKRKPQPLAGKRQQYMIAPRSQFQLAGLQPLGFKDIQGILESEPDVEINRSIEPKGFGALSTGGHSHGGVLVASMPEEKARSIAQNPQVALESDQLLELAEQFPGLPQAAANPTSVIPFRKTSSHQFRVVDEAGKGIPNAVVTLHGDSFPASGSTNKAGNVTLEFSSSSGAGPTAVHVNPQSGYWDFWLKEPALVPREPAVVALSPLTGAFPEISSREVLGWGAVAMGLDKIPTEFRGAGTKIAIIDSGSASETHNVLGHLAKGADLTVSPMGDGWTVDEIAHGSHCAGVITGIGTAGVRGFAPDAEVHTLKVFPGGRFSNLLEALDYCIEHQIDVANLSLGTPEPSQLVADKLKEAHQNGIACVAAAGNSADHTQFPGTSPHVLTVAAIGMLGTFPDTSYHAQQIGPAVQLMGDPTSFFSAKFTCYGPEVDVCAPGVAVLSSVPPDGYACWDGTSMAAPHVTGLAALILAHHPDFKTVLRPRNAMRVEQLFNLLRRSAVPLDAGDSRRTGAGMPHALSAFQSTVLDGVPRGSTPPEQLHRHPNGSDLATLLGRLGQPHAPGASWSDSHRNDYGPSQTPPVAEWRYPAP